MRVFHNALYMYAMQAVNTIIGLLLLPYITRVLGSEALGVQAFGISVCDLVNVMAMSVVVQLGVRRIAQTRNVPEAMQQEVSLGLTFQLFFLGVASILFIVWAFLQRDGYTHYYLLLLLYLAAYGFDISWIFNGLENFRPLAVRTMLVRSATLIFTVLFVKEKSDLWLYIVIHGGALLVGNLILRIHTRRYHITLQPGSLRMMCKKWLPAATAILIPTLLSTLLITIDRILLGHMVNKQEVAIYDYPLRLVRVGSIVVGVITTVFYPRFSHLWQAHENKVFWQTVKQQLLYSFLAGCWLAGLGLTQSELVCSLLFGEDFMNSHQVLFIMCIALPMLGSGLYNLCFASGREKQLIWGMLGTVVLMILSDFGVIPRYGAIGAAWVYVGVNWLLQGYYLWVLRDVVKIPWILKQLLALFGGITLGAFVLHWITIENLWLALIVKSILFSIIFVLSYWLLSTEAQRECARIMTLGRNWWAQRKKK